MSNIAVYPGTFDPITNGHISIIQRGLKVFDKIIIAISENPKKNTLFSLEKRINLIKKANIPKTEVQSFKGLLTDFCTDINVSVIIRGLRAVSDFDYEFQLALANRRMNRNVETVFIMTDYKYSYLSSSLVKDMASYKGNIEGLVPLNVKKALEGVLR